MKEYSTYYIKNSKKEKKNLLIFSPIFNMEV